MKIALYIEDGLEQLVLTPDSEYERTMLQKIHDGARDLSIKSGGFYRCRGGWTRHKQMPHSPFDSATNDEDESTIIVLTRKPEKASE